MWKIGCDRRSYFYTYWMLCWAWSYVLIWAWSYVLCLAWSYVLYWAWSYVLIWAWSYVLCLAWSYVLCWAWSYVLCWAWSLFYLLHNDCMTNIAHYIFSIDNIVKMLICYNIKICHTICIYLKISKL